MSEVSKLQGEVDQVQDIVRGNISSLVERGEQLDQLDEAARALEEGAGDFKTTAVKIKRKQWWQNRKMTIVIAVVVILVIIVVVIAAVLG